MENVTLDPEQQRRALVLTQLVAGRVTTVEAAASLNLSERQLQRLRPRYRRQGVAALVHGNVGREPVNTTSGPLRRRVAELAKTKYVGFNFEHLTEMLAEDEGIELSSDTVRRICLDAGVHPPRRRRRQPARRQRRERCAREGELVQFDGSTHDWLEGRGPRLTLLNAVDDATARKWAQFDEGETVEGYMALFRLIVAAHGAPLAAYTDGLSTIRNRERFHAVLATERIAQLRRALEELGTIVIVAGSPQAKGRVERTHGLDQDRLVSLLRLHGASSLSDARLVLLDHLHRTNRRFVRAAADPTPAWLPRDRRSLDDVFCIKEERTVGRDNTVRVYGRTVDIPAGSPRRDYAGLKVAVHRRFDGSLAVFHEGRRLVVIPSSTPSPDLTRPTKSLRG